MPDASAFGEALPLPGGSYLATGRVDSFPATRQASFMVLDKMPCNSQLEALESQ